MAQSPISRSGRFSKGPSQEVQDYSESISFDWRLYQQDIAGSIAHATMLSKIGVLTQGELRQITRGLQKIEREITAGTFVWKRELEDVHMNIEAALTARVPCAAKLHTGRSRNDQVATDLRLWVRNEISTIRNLICKLQQALWNLAYRHRTIAIPGYTHLQRAQPVWVAHHLLAYIEMLARDEDRFASASKRANISPLGSGALAGTSLPLQRETTARLLKFDAPSTNSMDAVGDRDFVAEFLFASALTGVHLSRLAEDLILWSSAEFNFIRIGDSHTTGSSLMPQKKNPDVAELGRGKTGRLIGNLMSLLVTLKGLPMTYNRDLQEDKEPLFDSADTLRASLSVFASMLDSTEFRKEICQAAVSDPCLLATELADDLVLKGVPFRQAHHAVGAAVKLAEERKESLNNLQLSDWKKIHPKFDDKITERLTLQKAFSERNSLIGSPGTKQVLYQLACWKKRLF